MGNCPGANALFPILVAVDAQEEPRSVWYMDIVRNEREGGDIANLVCNIWIGPRELGIWYK